MDRQDQVAAQALLSECGLFSELLRVPAVLLKAGLPSTITNQTMHTQQLSTLLRC